MEKGIVTYINPYSYLKLRNHSELESFDFITSDGIIIKILANLFLHKSPQRLSPDFSSYFNDLFLNASESNNTIYFVGAKPEIIKNALINFYRFC